jgi:predicted nucleotidyltransferase
VNLIKFRRLLILRKKLRGTLNVPRGTKIKKIKETEINFGGIKNPPDEIKSYPDKRA